MVGSMAVQDVAAAGGRSLAQAPDADGQQGQDVDGQEQPGQRAVAAGDQIDQAEARGDEDRADQQTRAWRSARERRNARWLRSAR